MLVNILETPGTNCQGVGLISYDFNMWLHSAVVPMCK